METEGQHLVSDRVTLVHLELAMCRAVLCRAVLQMVLA